MANIAFIPVRGGSKSIPLKNIKILAGKPLLYWVSIAAQEASCIDKIIIATDSSEIKKVALNLNLSKLEVYDREEQNAQDNSSTESVMLEYIHAAKLHKSDNLFLIQATSPLLTSTDIDNMYEEMQNSSANSALSCVNEKRFYWNKNGTPINYDYKNRPRRQDFDGCMMENGACYINSVENILLHENRLSGKIYVHELPEYTATEIDEPDDWLRLESLMRKYKLSSNTSESFICKMLLTDCDGVLTDGGMYYSSDGEVLKKFNTRDGMAFELLRNKGIITGIITGENSQTVVARANKIKADECFIGIKNKLAVVKEIASKYGILLSEIAYIGDDLNDLEVLQNVGFSACPFDANEKIKSNVQYIANAKGGEGVVREVCDRLL